MKHFLALSFLLHGAIFLFLFSCGMPSVPNVPDRVIQVSLVSKKEEPLASKTGGSVMTRKEREKEIQKEVPQSDPKREKGIDEVKSQRADLPVEEEKESGRGVKKAFEEEVPPAKTEKPSPIQTLGKNTSEGNEKSGNPIFVGESVGKSVKTRETGMIFLPSSAVQAGGGRGAFEKAEGNFEQVKGNGPPVQRSKAHLGGKEGKDSVLQVIIRKIDAAKRYPRAAWRMGIEGTAVVRFKLQPTGQVESVELVETSGSELLDKASLENVRAAAPLPFQEGWLKIGIVFKIL